MRLRTRIFRRLVLFALIPSIIITAAAVYFMSEVIDQTSVWLSVSSPDRTINSMRLIETRLQETARQYLQTIDFEILTQSDSLVDWWVVSRKGQIATSLSVLVLPPQVDSVFKAGSYEPGMVHRVIDGYLMVGACLERGDSTIACGYIFEREYLNGFQAASATLKESRRFQNLMPGFILFLVVSGATVLVLIIVIAYFLSRRLSASVTNPLESLTVMTAAVAQGDTPQSISVSGTEEISRLTETFNRMLVDLEESRKRLVAAERVAAWQGFARRMAHELKNPLTPISLSLYRIKKALEESGHLDRFADSIEAISAQVERLERLANDYSSLAKLPEPKIKPFDFMRTINELINLHAAQLDDYSFERQIPDQPLEIEGDPDHLHQVMVNLIKNAMEFTAEGERIIISAGATDQTVWFQIANEGNDISEADLSAAKMPYFSTREGGTGLGLAVSEKIIIDHDGNLTLEKEGRMTVARFEIPRKRSR